MDGMMRALAKNKTQWKEDFFFAGKLARQKLFKYCAQVTPTMGILLISAHILDVCWKLQSLTKWDMGIDINHADEISYTTQYQEAGLKYKENEYCAKHRCVSANKLERLASSKIVPSAMASRSWQSSFDTYDLSSNVEEFIMPNKVAEMTHG